MRVDPSIFKAYDIRGVFPDPLSVEVAEAVGRAFATLLQPAEVVVGHDMRLSSPDVFSAVVAGLVAQGVDVVDIGMVSTDQYYYSCAVLERPGMMVTASHNPPEYSGFKMVRRMPFVLSAEDGIQELRAIVEEDAFAESSSRGQVTQRDMSADFVDYVSAMIEPTELKPLRVVADTANGMVGPILSRVFDRLPVELIGMYLEPDGSLPNHGLDPMQEENRRDLQRRVVVEGADVGFAFDGDGDRFFVIDDRGRFVPGDFLTALLACYLLEREPGGTIIYDVRCSWAVPEMVGAAGGRALVERVGHAFMKPKMFEEKAIFAGELSGHYYLRDFFGADSGIVPALFVLEMLSRRDQKLSQLLAPIERDHFISWEINSRVDDPQNKIRILEQRYADGQITHIDGISVSYPDWHFNVRSSNTEPLLRLNLEGRTRQLMELKRDEILAIIRDEA
jgi:phosphomannomutase